MPGTESTTVLQAPLRDRDWLIEPAAFGLVRERAEDSAAKIIDGVWEDALPGVSVDTKTGIATVTISGVLDPTGYYGGTSLIACERLFDALRQDASVRAVFLEIDSPGGTVAGTADAADALAQLAAAKPTHAYGPNLIASGAFWLASQAEEITMQRTGHAGSIGTLLVVYDWSKLLSERGIGVHVFSTGPLKGTGVVGAPLTEEQQQYLQQRVEQLQQHFSAAVMVGRGLDAEQLALLATGAVFGAGEAAVYGLIDGVKSRGAALAALAAQLKTGGTGNQKREERMAASYQELIEACAGLDPKSAEDAQALCEMQAQGLDVQAAARKWAQTLQARAEIAREEAATARAEAEQAKAAGNLGVEALEEQGTAGRTGGGSAREEFFAKVAEKEAKGTPRAKAVSQVTRDHPDLQREMIEEVNAHRPRRAAAA